MEACELSIRFCVLLKPCAYTNFHPRSSDQFPSCQFKSEDNNGGHESIQRSKSLVLEASGIIFSLSIHQHGKGYVWMNIAAEHNTLFCTPYFFVQHQGQSRSLGSDNLIR